MTHIYAVYKRPTSEWKISTGWKWRDGKNMYYADGDEKKTRVAILLYDKIYCKTKAVKRDREGHYMILKGSVQ